MESFFVDAVPIQMDMASDESIVVCKGLTRYIGCRDGSNILVTEAFWGRDSAECPSDNGDPVMCTGSTSVLALVKSDCDTKKGCSLEATSTKLGSNGCSDVNKYLVVNYTCVPESKGVLLCDSALTKLTCPLTWIIEVKNVFWGRSASSTYCDGPSDGCATNENALLFSENYVKAICNNQNECLIKADSAVLGDTCPVVSKYLLVNYVCKPPTSSTT